MATTVVEPDTDFDVSLLSQEQKLNLIERLWNAIDESAIPVPDSHMRIVRERSRQAKEDPTRVTTLDEFMRRQNSK